MSQTPFENLGISQELLRAVHELGFKGATEIQARTIPLIMQGQDVIGRSQTGTGKTAAFGIPAIELIDGENKTDVQVLVVCPTRELAIQSWDKIKRLYKYKTGVKAAVVYGGQQIDRQIKELKRGVNIVIGTPGRIMDHMRRKTLRLDHAKMVVLDEADEMLDMGFREDIETILRATPGTRQTIFFSATMPPEILAITKIYQKNPRLVEVNARQMTLTAIEQYYCEVPSTKKPEAIVQLFKDNQPHKAIVFCNTQRMVDSLCKFLNQNGYQAVGIHGDIKQNVRTIVMENFKSGKVSLLVATDVAARGIDARDVDWVFNYDIPPSIEYYVHRIGRTGRAGKAGKAFTIVSGKKQMMQLRDIERATKAHIVFQDVEVAGHVLHLNNRPSDDSGDTGPSERHRWPEGRAPAAPKPGTSRIVINLGREQHVSPNHIVGAIAEKTSLSGSDIGKIVIGGNSSTVEIPDASGREVVSAINGTKINGLPADVRLQDAGLEKNLFPRPGRAPHPGRHSPGRNGHRTGGHTNGRRKFK